MSASFFLFQTWRFKSAATTVQLPYRHDGVGKAPASECRVSCLAKRVCCLDCLYLIYLIKRSFIICVRIRGLTKFDASSTAECYKFGIMFDLKPSGCEKLHKFAFVFQI